MTRTQRKQLISDANEAFDRPFMIYNRDEYGDNAAGSVTGFYIQTPSDERMFIDFGSSKTNWAARSRIQKCNRARFLTVVVGGAVHAGLAHALTWRIGQ